jgi:hypothetical protein
MDEQLMDDSKPLLRALCPSTGSRTQTYSTQSRTCMKSIFKGNELIVTIHNRCLVNLMMISSPNFAEAKLQSLVCRHPRDTHGRNRVNRREPLF